MDEIYTNLTDREKEEYLDDVIFAEWRRDFRTLYEYTIYLDLWMSTRPARPVKSWYKLQELLKYTECQVTQKDIEALVERGVIKTKIIKGQKHVWFTPISTLVMAQKKKPRPKYHCVVCGSELTGNQRKYCGEKCRRTAQGLGPKRTTCQKCGKLLPEGRYKFCHQCKPAPNTCEECSRPCFGEICAQCYHKGGKT